MLPRSLTFVVTWLRACILRCVLGLALGLVPGVSVASAQLSVMPLELERVDVNEQLDKPLPTDAVFRDHTGKLVKLGDFFDGKRPVMLTLAYHTCKVVCSMVLGAEVEVLKQQPWTLGQEYRAVTISIDPRDTPAAAAKKRKQMLALYGKGGQSAQWDFLVGDQANIDKVARAVGFQYRYDPRHDQYAHPAVLMMATPAAKMARYLYGLSFAESDVRLGLLEASQGRSISTVEKVLLYCYMYDPIGAKYVVIGKNVMKIAGVITMLSLGLFLAILWRRERRRSSLSTARSTLVPSGESGRTP
jgi:protein SCO1/2